MSPGLEKSFDIENAASGLTLIERARNMESHTQVKPITLNPKPKAKPKARLIVTVDGNYAAASVAHRVSETIAIFPITPSSTMGEWADRWSAEGKANIWGTVPAVIEMQSEGGAAGVIHGALQTGTLATTFTASQGLLLMIPNMYKIAGELTPTVFHVSARTIATHALSIFGDHSDVMATRATGFAMLASGSVQEVMDNAIIAHAATLESRIPFLHFFDGFRTSHEVLKIEQLSDDDLRAMINDKTVFEHRSRALNPERPVLRGSSQNPDVFFQAREAANPYYKACADIVQAKMDQFAKLVGRQYHLFDYVGAPDATRVIVMMGSGAETTHETVEHLVSQGEKVGLLKVRLYRPFASQRFVAALPNSTQQISVLDRTKEPGASGEPLYQDVVTALAEYADDSQAFDVMPKVVGGRYGLSSKEFTPAMVKGVFDELKKHRPMNHFTVGINDDVSNTSLSYDPSFSTEDEQAVQAVFYGLGSDGTVSANKSSIQIIGEQAGIYAQGYFVYDSKKAGSVTVSHLRFGERVIRSAYSVQTANFVACHQSTLMETVDVLERAAPGSKFLLNTQAGADDAWNALAQREQRTIIEKQLEFYVIDAYKLAKEAGLGRRISTIMQTCFFAISGVLPLEQANKRIKYFIRKSYGSKGEAVVNANYAAVDQAIKHLTQVKVPAETTNHRNHRAIVAKEAPKFVQDVTAVLIAGEGDQLPVSAIPADGTFPTNTARWEKRNLAMEIPVWDCGICIQCNKCVLVCPHAAIRANVYDPSLIESAPKTYQSTQARGGQFKDLLYTLQVAPEDCTGCGLCVEVCPASDKSNHDHKAINMAAQQPLRDQERDNFSFFLDLPSYDRSKLKVATVKESQFLLPLFEYSGACTGCGETPYVKLVSQLFGDRAIIANATGCSSIYGGNLPTTPWATNQEGRGPAWSNSLFEDNAEFGLGFRLSIEKQREFARELLMKLAGKLDDDLVTELLSADQSDEKGIATQRERVDKLKEHLQTMETPESFNLLSVADALVKRSVWIIGGDGWAYDIGYGGLDHVLASGHNVNVLVLDTEVYSNTGGQMSKATPCGAVAKFAVAGKSAQKKDLGMMAINHGLAYVATVAMGANDNQTVRAIVEAESYEGPSIVIAYSHCIAHGIDMRAGLSQQKAAVECGHWPLYRYDPRRIELNLNPFQLDSKAPSIPVRDYIEHENRFKSLWKTQADRADKLLEQAQQAAESRYKAYAERAKTVDQRS